MNMSERGAYHHAPPSPVPRNFRHACPTSRSILGVRRVKDVVMEPRH